MFLTSAVTAGGNGSNLGIIIYSLELFNNIMVERIPLTKQISYDIWKNVRKLGSDFYPVITINFSQFEIG
jgi:hypothetical protein